MEHKDTLEDMQVDGKFMTNIEPRKQVVMDKDSESAEKNRAKMSSRRLEERTRRLEMEQKYNGDTTGLKMEREMLYKLLESWRVPPWRR